MPSSRLLPVCLASLLSTAGALAAPVNLLANGSFENGLTGWSTAGSGAATVTYGSTSNGAFGEAVRADGLAGASPDAAGQKAAYFSNDYALNAKIGQTLSLSAGTYRFGFDAYAPANGMGNPVDASFALVFAGTRLGGSAVSSLPTAAWVQYAGTVNIAAAGNYALDFVFNAPGGGYAKDLAIDRLYVIAANAVAARSTVPEPASIALVLLGIAGIAAIHRRRRDR